MFSSAMSLAIPNKLLLGSHRHQVTSILRSGKILKRQLFCSPNLFRKEQLLTDFLIAPPPPVPLTSGFVYATIIGGSQGAMDP